GRVRGHAGPDHRGVHRRHHDPRQQREQHVLQRRREGRPGRRRQLSCNNATHPTAHFPHRPGRQAGAVPCFLPTQLVRPPPTESATQIFHPARPVGPAPCASVI